MPAWAGRSHCPQRPRARGRAAHCVGSECPLRMPHASVQLPCPVCSTAGPHPHTCMAHNTLQVWHRMACGSSRVCNPIPWIPEESTMEGYVDVVLKTLSDLD